jgi:hypothetical protein
VIALDGKGEAAIELPDWFGPDRAYVFLQPDRVALQDVTGGIIAIPAVLRMQLHFRNKY